MQYPKAKTIHLVLDNLNIHRRKSLPDLYDAEIGGEIWDRFTIHSRQRMEAGSIRRKSKSQCSRASVSAAGASRT
jgi:hypothetical protein